MAKNISSKKTNMANNRPNCLKVTKKAQKDKYDYVFAKSVVLYGGKDITSEINVK